MKNDYEIRGDKAAIFLTRRDGIILETIIDLAVLEKVKLIEGKWYANTKKTIDSYYVLGHLGNGKTVYLHRYILDAPKFTHVDHINHDTLDNTRENLRIATPAENHQNRKQHKRNKSGSRGVFWYKHRNKWKARVFVNGSTKFEKLFDTKEEAVIAVKNARKELMPFSNETLDERF